MRAARKTTRKNAPATGQGQARSAAHRINAPSLLNLARQRSDQSREALAAIMTGLIEGRSGPLSDAERVLVAGILRDLFGMVQQSAAQRLVERLADNSTCPHDLIWFLANEPIETARPVLLRSPVLRDPDLTDLVLHKSKDHRIVIARRPNLSESVSGTLARAGEPEVVAELLRNETAMLAQATLAFLVDRARAEQLFHDPLARRPDLTPDLARKLSHWVSAALRQYIQATWAVDVGSVDPRLDVTLDKAAPARPRERPDTRADALAQQVVADQARTRRMVVSAMTEGDTRLAVSVVSAALGAPKDLARRLLFEAGDKPLAVACAALGLSRTEFLDVHAGAARLGARAAVTPKAAVDEDPALLGAFFDRLREEEARTVIARWIRQPDALGAPTRSAPSS